MSSLRFFLKCLPSLLSPPVRACSGYVVAVSFSQTFTFVIYMPGQKRIEPKEWAEKGRGGSVKERHSKILPPSHFKRSFFSGYRAVHDAPR